MKCEPAAYTIDDLARDGRTCWEGVRNYQARNFMRDDMRVGDGVLFYASNADPAGVTGVARICRTRVIPITTPGSRDTTTSMPAAPRKTRLWYMVRGSEYVV